MKTLLLIALQLAASGGDAYYTHTGLQMGHIERNPIARPFVSSTAGQVAWFGTGAAIHIGGAHWLRKHHHGKLGDALAVEGIGESTFGATYSAIHQ